MEERGGYKVTVDGVLADNQTMIVFYTLENLSGSGESKDSAFMRQQICKLSHRI
ncbi:MAG: DUF4179 domain-containing protein [Paenibacillus macerans]|uniref:DUF4179 domain-containing protein n=1 Tax=Paenibacillus macerans TaxID=44252 RepID=A0A090ZB92_PAEMA|nr:DUF4179 domain-containing protein [Paenibacillus macerans]KFN07668.1 hypothetical protein DJ90_6100 [Paenibacillus macerans]MBS5914702.1 DUF4179 domain-containing protein [Paenibacillus macerans]MCY7559602.1 DUF4179 domain-containing protein [Paenibacillus macerans]MDU5949639.1 DUF4179 domain-containing protein [Paenibacillus macerans]MDU7474083.1 DUF4179 domain-containing protein [Paenibacillus macerans]